LQHVPFRHLYSMRLLTAVSICWFVCTSMPLFAQSADNYLQAAVLFKESGDYSKAISVLAKAREKFGDKDIEQFLVRLYFLNAQPPQALAILVREKQKDWLDYLYLGLIYEELGDNQKALNHYRQSFSLQPTSISLLRSAKIYRKQKQYEQAAHFFSRLLKLDSSIRLAYYYLGDCLLRAGQYSRAYASLSKASLFYPHSLAVKEKLAKARQALGEGFFKQKKEQKEKARKKIRLPFYVPQENIPIVRVGLARDIEEFSFSCASEFVFVDGKHSFAGEKNIFYTVAAAGDTIAIKDYETKQELARFAYPLDIKADPNGVRLGSFYVLDISYGKNMFWHKQLDRIYRGELQVLVRQGKITLINRLSIEEYLQGVLAAEISAGSPEQALRAQAVAARTLAYRNRNRHKNENFDFCADVHCQVYQGVSAETSATNKAVADTRGLIMTYQGKPVETFYHANSGGCLAADVFGDKGYLETKIDASQASLPLSAYEQERWFMTYPETFSTAGRSSSFRWQRVYDSEDFFLIFGRPLKDVRSIEVESYGDCFHSTAMKISTTSGTKRLEGDLAIRNYFDGLRSSAFRIDLQLSVDKTISRIFFWGAGFGHGAGMSQEGAVAMAEAGYDYRAILKHYYPGTSLASVY